LGISVHTVRNISSRRSHAAIEPDSSIANDLQTLLQRRFEGRQEER
jgi:hypothetical protein